MARYTLNTDDKILNTVICRNFPVLYGPVVGLHVFNNTCLSCIYSSLWSLNCQPHTTRPPLHERSGGIFITFSFHWAHMRQLLLLQLELLTRNASVTVGRFHG